MSTVTRQPKRNLTPVERAEVKRLRREKGSSYGAARAHSWKEGIAYRVVRHPKVGVFICGADVWEMGESADPGNVVLAEYQP